MMTTTPALEGVIHELVDRLGDAVQRDAPLGPLTTYRVGGPAAALIIVDDDQSLLTLAAVLAMSEVPILVIGRGSNLLVADSGFAGVVVQLGGQFARIDIDGATVWAGAATKLPVLARQTVSAGLTGLEWAVGVPGSVGGAVRMNAGGHGAEVVDSLASVQLVDFRSGELVDRDAASLELSYRSSALDSSEVLVRARFELTEGDIEQGEQILAEIVQWRRSNQPGGQNAGSVFTNPPGDSAGRLIDTAGGKGLRIGSAEVSTKHANFIQSDEGGSAHDVLAVMNEVKRLVLRSHGVTLHTETHLIGFEDDRAFS